MLDLRDEKFNEITHRLVDLLVCFLDFGVGQELGIGPAFELRFGDGAVDAAADLDKDQGSAAAIDGELAAMCACDALADAVRLELSQVVT